MPTKAESVVEARSVPPSSLGTRLRALRRARSLSLSEVAEATRISASFLSLVENGRSDITIGRLTRLVDFYRVTINDLLPVSGGDDTDVVRRGDARQLHSPDEGIDVYLLTSGTDGSMMPMLLEFEPSAGLVEFGHHAGEEFVHVIEGELRLEIEGSAPRLLQAGDSAYYAGDRPHLFRNSSDKRPLRLLCIDSPPAI
jgi:transcriptional regulator with XRE-family HTH domain